MATDTFLSDEEVQALTERRVRPAQVRALKTMGIEHRVRPDGSIAILRAHADSRTTKRIYRRKAEVVKPLK